MEDLKPVPPRRASSLGTWTYESINWFAWKYDADGQSYIIYDATTVLFSKKFEISKCIDVIVCPPRPPQGLLVDPPNNPLPPEPASSSSSSSSTEESDIDIPELDDSDSSLGEPKFEPKLPSVGCRAPPPNSKDETKSEAAVAAEKKEGNGHAPYEHFFMQLISTPYFF